MNNITASGLKAPNDEMTVKEFENEYRKGTIGASDGFSRLEGTIEKIIESQGTISELTIRMGGKIVTLGDTYKYPLEFPKEIAAEGDLVRALGFQPFNKYIKYIVSYFCNDKKEKAIRKKY